ncbi:MAG: hypothetical protein HYS21_02440 [Deltaproteobacteria bacterium]|nr:hypothetical protein [Deltaproteobacteria bacterium]
MDRQIRIKITPDGRVEIDSSVFTDCKEVAEHLTKTLGKMESFSIKEDHLDEEIKVKVNRD